MPTPAVLTPPAQTPGAPARGLRPSAAEATALGVTALSAIAFLIVQPPVGDLFAARARASAVEHGVGLRYWFAWFGGIVPGRYSLLEPYVAAAVGTALLGVVSAVAVAAAAFVALTPTRHRAAAMGFVAVGASCNLWSGRVPFQFGMVFALLGVICVHRRRPLLAAVAGALAAAITPTAALFLIFGLVGVLAVDRSRRWAALAGCLGAGLPVLAIAAYFGSPGPEGFQVGDAVVVMVGTALMLALRTPPQVRIVAAVSLLATLVVLIVPNGLGSNVERFAWFCLTAACVATSTSSRLLTYGAAGVAITMAVLVTGRDLRVAAQPMSSPAYYRALTRELDSIHGLQDYRIESVFDGTHNAAYALLGHVQQARGYETQSNNTFDAVLDSPDLNAAGYRRWLSDNAVGYVVMSSRTLATGPEDTLVRHHRTGYLHRIWHDGGLTLYAVEHPTPVVAGPGRVVTASQSGLTVQATAVLSPVDVLVRVRWSRFLHLSHAPAGSRLQRGSRGWTTLHLTGPCRACEITG